MQKIMENKGITLIALVISIIILLILTGVTIGTALGDNGLIKQATRATESYKIASEREILLQSILSNQMSDVIDDEENKLGTKLSNRDSINNNHWEVIQMLDDSKNIYGNGYGYVPKGTNIEGYGVTQYNWVINYNTGEIINIGEEKENYIRMSYDAGLSVKDNLALNINPLNMADEGSWGNGVEFCNENNSRTGVSGYNGTEIKFDGQDDYLKLENIEIKESDGFTFEFYGKAQGNIIYPLEKTVTDPSDSRYDKMLSTRFRTILDKVSFQCCFSSIDSESDKRPTDSNNKHWLKFNEVKKNSDYDYISMIVNYNTDTVTIFSKGKEVAQTTCNHEYLVGVSLLDKTIPFTIGFYTGGKEESPDHGYSKFDLYACRLYTRALTSEEVEENFNETTSYHNYLVQE